MTPSRYVSGCFLLMLLLPVSSLVNGQPRDPYFDGCWGGCYVRSTGLTEDEVRTRAATRVATTNGVYDPDGFDVIYPQVMVFPELCNWGQKAVGWGSYTEGGVSCQGEAFVATGAEPKDPDECEGNPCNVVSGRKTQTETDLSFGALTFERYYDSGSPAPGTIMGARWRHSFELNMNNVPLLNSAGDHAIPPTIVIPPSVVSSSPHAGAQNACLLGWNEIRSDYREGRHAAGVIASYSDGFCKLLCVCGGAYTQVGTLSISTVESWRTRVDLPTGWGQTDAKIQTITTAKGSYYTFEDTSPGIYKEVSDYPVRLELEPNDQWLFYDDKTIDRIDDGVFLSRTLVGGRSLTLNYGTVSGLLDSVTDDEGNSISFDYNVDGHIEKLIHPDGDIDYAYDIGHNLISVTYEDGKVRQYHYEDSRFPNHLTGITDERGVRYATWAYDIKGRATTSEHGSTGADLVTLVYGANSTTVTDASGGVRTYQIDIAGARPVVTGVTGDKCIDCARGGMKSRNHDGTGYMNEVTDWEGNITDYDYDSRGLEIQRIEAKGTALARTISTEWHPDFRLRTKVIEPGRTTEFTYDATGRLLQRKVTP